MIILLMNLQKVPWMLFFEKCHHVPPDFFLINQKNPRFFDNLGCHLVVPREIFLFYCIYLYFCIFLSNNPVSANFQGMDLFQLKIYSSLLHFHLELKLVSEWPQILQVTYFLTE